MRQTPEAEAFLTRIAALPAGPGVSLNDALQPSINDETQLRRLWATDRSNARLNDPHVGLVDVFDAPMDIKITRARVVNNEEDLSAKYVMPLNDTNRRKEGTPSMAIDLDEFKKNWSIFTEGSLSQLVDWNHVVAAGGSVLACLTPLPDSAKVSKRAIRKYYHTTAYPTSDVDLFLWGMTPEEAEVKINAIYEAVRDSVPWDVTCVRTKHTVSIHSQYPYRSVQIVLRLYSSPAEILAGFDIDAPSCAYDGERVWANPRAIVAMMRQCNTVDMTRRSPSYEVRLAKYSSRAYEVYVPTLEREKIDPTIYERSIARMEGLARLLVLEKLIDTDARTSFLDARRALRGRPSALNRYSRRNKRKYKGDLKEDTAIGGLEMNDYDVASLHIPYGPGWDARRIDKLIYQTDLGMNSTFNPKNKGRRLHRHPAFFGTMHECLEDCCEASPFTLRFLKCPVPVDDDEQKLQEEEDTQYIRGRISFMEEDPGRQTMSGSFNPIDVGEWSEQVYIKPTQRFFAAIASHKRELVKQMIEEGIDVNHRDHVGRAPLHVAILSKAADIACDLIDAGARMTARLVDGKFSLHLAAEHDQVTVIRKLFERSAVNAEQAKVEAEKEDEDEKKEDVERPSSEDDWSSDDNDGKAQDDEDGDDEGDDDGGENNDEDEEEEDGSDNRGGRKKKSDAPSSPESADATGDMPEDETDEPDILDVNLPDWDFGFAPICYAILFASLPVIEALIGAGADVKLTTKGNTYDSTPVHPLTLTLIREDEDEACKVAARLVLAGASSATADEQMCTIFHAAVLAEKVKVVATLLRCDPNARVVLDFPILRWSDVVFPLASAISSRNYAMMAVILAHGGKVEFVEEDITRAQTANRPNYGSYGVKNYLNNTYMPAETAIKQHDDVIQLLLALGTPINIGLKDSLREYSSVECRRTLVDWVKFAISDLSSTIAKEETVDIRKEDVVGCFGWKGYMNGLYQNIKDRQAENDNKSNTENKTAKLNKLKETKSYLLEVQRLLLARGAKTWSEVYPDTESTAKNSSIMLLSADSNRNTSDESSYTFIPKAPYGCDYVPQHLIAAYDELFEACFAGDNEKVQKLCLPDESAPTPTTSLRITVQVKRSTNYYDTTGYSPLFAAISGRRWSTAKLILAIATAQYHPDDEDEQEMLKKFKMDLDDDSNDGSDCSDDSDDTIEQREVKFVDIVARSSVVQCDVPPQKMLDDLTFSMWQASKDENGRGFTINNTLIERAVRDHDLEAFVHIANLYQSLPHPLPLKPTLLQSIVSEDQPDILDEFIRRTGEGIDIKSTQNEEDEEASAVVNDENRIYLGLNVHGKKRTDLARKNDPNAVGTPQVVTPLLWSAISGGAKATVEYLNSERPLAAYRFFASTARTSERTERIRRTMDLQKVIPEWLGWTITPIGDSPLFAAIVGNDLDILKLLFKQKPSIMAQAVKEKIKFLGYNPILFASHHGCSSEIIDFLLSKGISPTEKDTIKGWNIYHHIAVKNHWKLLEHLLRKLPRDVSEALLAQQSKGRHNTPLLLAVKTKANRIAKLMVDFDKSTVVSRDIDGSTPLHIAASNGSVEITQLLLAAVPAEALYFENGVGHTPLEVASLQEFTLRFRQISSYRNGSLAELHPNSVDTEPPRYPIKELEKRLPELQAIIDQLTAEERLKNQTKLAGELNNFFTVMESRLGEAKAAAKNAVKPAKKVEEKDPRDRLDIKETIIHLCEAATTTPSHRQLVHLIDVQKSVAANLAKIAKGNEDEDNLYSRYRHRRENRNDEEGLQPEEDEEKKERERSFIFRYVNMTTDKY
ncbi:hypothetical protein BDQ12DRAFT_766148 [Crucibulum laeve]|uniref:Ankyrin repeat-containing domain protein n=1 Tax=Crucibulum laeve TaxID=68775 RepID=A0A5C3LM76_9AGAR|nr:hypothetical protein BDQ12DRAFT_766148 [Crucibulum laeve]